MGFLDKLLGGAAKKALDDAIGNVTGKNSDEISGSTSYTNPAPQQQSPSLPPDYVPDLDVEQKLDKILASEFPSYQVAKEVPPTTMGGVGVNMMPYTYVISKDGQPKLIIMRCWNNTCASRGYRFSKEFAVSQGITLINFLENSPNEESYIIDRLHQYL
ncbi:MAG: hypothetical protein IK106_03080 [Clostridiales bacterium]|nr:hypothetical protein [Clostridiales bacterium]